MIIGIDCSRAFVTEKTGTENYSYHLITQILQLPEAKSHTFVLFTRPNVEIPDEIRKSNVYIKPIKLRYLWTQVGLAYATWQKPNIDVLWVPAHTLPVLRPSGLKTVVTIHGLEYQWLPEYRNLLQRWYLPLSTYYAARAANQLIAVSQYTKEQLVKELQTDSKKIKVIQEGVSDTRMTLSQIDQNDTLRRYRLEKERYLLFVGTLQPRKNLPALLEAFSLFASEFPDYRLVMAGGVGWMAESIFSAVDRLHLQDKVIFTGRVSESALASLYQSAFLYVQPSVTEGFGLPVLEAMKQNLPVVSSDGGALPETVGTAGVVVPLGPTFALELSRAFAMLVRDVSKRSQLILLGKKRVSLLSWKRAASETLSLLVKTSQL
jgi:glycosyltransferase involved in cell wall biosynthesis